MADVEDDFADYQDTRDREGGLHPGRSDVPRGLNFVVAVAAAVILAAAAALVFIR
ncbi:hypothetical protein [Urbifossiella limnaea]|uniref:Uncharacterized protein n=1 Tax=Urbifossiella limnaea TaxID=2528023 RepID=A0A517XYH0_9BACT|nr:hypothetical protein [Urbifossiella limnaea]QDU22555.1 hypothetical protein ETAA1_45380 [Urbifossiella limnaea]